MNLRFSQPTLNPLSLNLYWDEEEHFEFQENTVLSEEKITIFKRKVIHTKRETMEPKHEPGFLWKS